MKALVLALALVAGSASAQQDGLSTRAEAGEAAAQYALAQEYHAGTARLQDYAQAALWAQRAAEAGVAGAQNLLGRYYAEGLGVPADAGAALRWLGAAGEQGDPAHLYDHARALETLGDGAGDLTLAARLYAKAAEAGHADAGVSLGVLYQEGRGVTQDAAIARQIYARYAQKGHARAQNNLGMLYARGTGVEQDYALAARLFQAAVDQGLRPAMTNLGVMYANGFGVPVDEARAEALYRQGGGQPDPQAAPQGPLLIYDARLAPVAEDLSTLQAGAEAGDPVAQFQLGWALMQPETPPHGDQRRAAELFARAANAGYPPAMANLGVLYFEGRGVAQDYMLGLMWLTLAARSGAPQITALRSRYAALPTTGQIAQAQARAAAHPMLQK